MSWSLWRTKYPEKMIPHRKRDMLKEQERGSDRYWAHRERMWKAHGNPMTRELYQELHWEQKGRCAICKKPEQKLFALQSDHNHSKTHLKTRGLLCSYCNRHVVGTLDNPNYIRGLVIYLFTWEPAALEGLCLKKTR